MLISLCVWQHNRAAEKNAYRASVEQALSTPPTVEKNEVLQLWHMTKIKGVFIPESTVVLAHQRVGDTVGWRILTAFKVHDNATLPLIVDRGFMPYGQNRLEPPLSELAQVSEGEVLLKGVYKNIPQRKTGGLGGPSYNTDKQQLLFLDPQLINNGHVNTEHYFVSQTPTHELLNSVLQLPPTGDKHREYMLTWLGLALVWPLLFLNAACLAYQRRRSK